MTFSRWMAARRSFCRRSNSFSGKSRMEDQVGVNVEGLIEIELEGVETDAGIIEIGAGVEIGAEGFEIFADFEGIARGSSLFEHALGEAARAESGGGIGGIAAFDEQREIDDGRGVALGENNFQAIGKRGLLHGRKLERFGGAFGGRFGTIDGRAGFVVGGIGRDFEDVIAIAEPLDGGFLDGGGSGGLNAL